MRRGFAPRLREQISHSHIASTFREHILESAIFRSLCLLVMAEMAEAQVRSAQSCTGKASAHVSHRSGGSGLSPALQRVRGHSMTAGLAHPMKGAGALAKRLPVTDGKSRGSGDHTGGSFRRDRLSRSGTPQYRHSRRVPRAPGPGQPKGGHLALASISVRADESPLRRRARRLRAGAQVVKSARLLPHAPNRCTDYRLTEVQGDSGGQLAGLRRAACWTALLAYLAA